MEYHRGDSVTFEEVFSYLSIFIHLSRVILNVVIKQSDLNKKKNMITNFKFRIQI